jgi:hypothetical protein
VKIIEISALTCTFRSYSTLKMSNFTLNNVEIFRIFTKSGIFTRGH